MTDPYRRRTIIRGKVGPTGPIGQPTRDPLGDMDLELNEEAALYVGVLEGQLAAYAINEVKYRVLLELITGESWYSTKVDVDTSALADIAAQALVRRGMDGVTARTVVNKRLSFGVQDEEMAPVQPPPEDVLERGDMATRFKAWKERQGRGGLERRREPSYIPPEIVVPPTTELVEPELVSVEGNELAPLPTESEPEPNIWSGSDSGEPDADQTLGPNSDGPDSKDAETQWHSESE